MLSLHDYEPAARRRLPHSLFNYIQGGCEDGISTQDNRTAFARWKLVPRALVDITKRTQSTEVFGQTYSSPFGIAPMGSSALFAYRGDLVLAQAARQAGIPMILSGASLIRLEEIADANPDCWFQAYLPGAHAVIEQMLDRLAAAGINTLALTVDTPVGANRENNIRAGFRLPLKPSLRLAWQGAVRPRWLWGTFLRTLMKHGLPHFENSQPTRGVAVLSRHAERAFADRGDVTWEHLKLIRRRWKGRLVLKGILHPDDAVAAREHGCDGIIVSNHGGRQLDGAVGALDMLPRILDVCGKELTVICDGGIRRGTDVLKALALGASMVLVGRPFLYAAAVQGRAGVEHAITLLREEISRDMAMIGATSIAALDPARHLYPV
jgi:L-lactate dehydrogenase (cytochrome)